MISAGKIFFILIWLQGISLMFPQEIDLQFQYSKDLYDKEEYFNAVTEFKRLLFFDTSGTYKYEANFLIGSAFKEGGRFSDAIHYFSEAAVSAENNEDFFRSKIEMVKSNILRRTPVQAHNLLNELDKPQFEEKSAEIKYWRGWVYIFNDEWDKAAEIFNTIEGADSIARFAEQVHDDKYSVTTAKILSYLLPGAGQFYTGNYVSGIISLGWNVLWAYFTIDAFIEDRIFDGIVIANFLWLRFYRGNVQNAEKFAIEQNKEITNNALKYLKNEYNGHKP